MKSCLCSTKVLFGELIYCIVPYQQNERSTQMYNGLILFCLLIYLSQFCSMFVVWQFMLSKCNLSQSATLNNSGPLPGTAKKTAAVVNTFINYGDLAYSHLWYAWIIVYKQY